MNKPVYTNEKVLFLLALIISALVWTGLVMVTMGAILAIIPFFFIIYLFAQSGLICYLKGTGALVSGEQFPDIQARVETCAEKTGLKVAPKFSILHGNGAFNAFATKFLRKHYMILLSDILDAFEEHPESINFYIGHEMGHIDRKHLAWECFLIPALTLPLLGAGYSRSREYTCDMYGALCCDAQSAQRGLAALAVGAKRWKSISADAYIAQVKETSGFWMSFHELIGNYPWLTKRFLRISPDFSKDKIPGRNVFAYLFAMFVPRFSIASVVVIYILFIALAAKGGGSFFKAAMQGQGTSAEQTAPEEYQVGKVYEGDEGKSYRYLGGDPALPQNWQAVEQQQAPQEEQVPASAAQ